MKLLNWLKERKIKKQEAEEKYYNRINFLISNNTESCGINFTDKMNELLFIDKKGEIDFKDHSNLSEDLVTIVFNMIKDKKFREQVYNYIFIDINNQEDTLLSLFIKNHYFLNDRAKEHLLNAFPLKNFYQILKRNENNKGSVIQLLLLDKSDFFIKFANFFGIGNLDLNKEIVEFEKQKVKLNILSFACVTEDINKKTKEYLLKYFLINEIYELLSLENRQILLYHITIKHSDMLLELKNNNSIKEEDVELIVRTLLNKYNKTESKKEESECIYLIKEIINIFEKDKDKDVYFKFKQEYEYKEKTYDMWLKEIIPENISYLNLSGMLITYFYSPKNNLMELNDKFFAKIEDRVKKVEKNIIESLYKGLYEIIGGDLLDKNFEHYLSSKIEMKIKSNIDWLINNIKDGFCLNEKNITLLKNYNIDPFEKNEQGESISSCSSSEVNEKISLIFFKEKIEQEKIELLQKIIEIEPNKTISNNKKRI